MLSFIKHKFAKSFNSKGQGTIEYVLLLIIIVFVVFGLLYQFNSAFGKFAQNYFGDYLACLLEYGELPSLGGSATTGACDAQFQPFDITTGRNPLGPGFGQDNDGKGSESKNNKNKNANANNGQNANSSSSGASSSSSGFGSRTRSNYNRSIVKGGVKGGNGDGDGSNDDLFGSTARPITESSYSVSILRPREIILPYFDEVEKKKKKTDKKPIAAKESENILRPPRMLRNDKALRKTASFQESETNIGFGGFIRFLFITAIVLVLVILLGSQALQISKEWD